NIRVIPVLVDGARAPNPDKLPDSIKPLARRNAVEIRNTHFGRDAEALTDKVREALKSTRPMTWRWPWFVLPERWRVVALTATALLLGWIGLNQMGMPVGAPCRRRSNLFRLARITPRRKPRPRRRRSGRSRKRSNNGSLRRKRKKSARQKPRPKRRASRRSRKRRNKRLL